MNRFFPCFQGKRLHISLIKIIIGKCSMEIYSKEIILKINEHLMNFTQTKLRTTQSEVLPEKEVEISNII